MKFRSPIDVDGYISLTTQNPGTTPTKYLVQDANGKIAFRTGQELKVDIGVDYTSVLKHQVKAGVAINKGQAVYVTSADGTNMTVGLASNTAEVTSSKTMGLLNATVAANGFADVITEGLLAGLNTIGANAGDPVWLGTNGNLIYGLANKPYAPNHLVFIGIVTRVNANNGEIFVKAQNGFELDELHDVDLKTTAKVNGHLLGYNGSLWVNKTIAEWLGYTPYNASNPVGYTTNVGTVTSVSGTGNYGGLTLSGTVTSSGNLTLGGTPTGTWPISVSGNADTVDNLHASDFVRAYSTSNDNIDSDWGQSFKTFDPIPSGTPPIASPNLRTINIGENYGRRTQLSFDYAANRAWFRRRQDSTWSAWSEFIHSDNISSFAVPSSRTITINGTSYDLSANRSWTVTASETDTLATVTARGATTSTALNLNGNVNFFSQLSVENQSTFARLAFNKLTFWDWQGSGDIITIDGGYLEAANSLRAPIFYDSNNTGYYVDPASTSNLNGLTVAGTISGNISGNAGGSSAYSRYFPTNYVGGVQSNPQVYFNYSQGLNVAMTGSWSTWSDTVWINGYSGADVPNMCALHFLRNGQPRMSISTQTREATSYGTYYEVLTDYNYASRSSFSGAVYGTIYYDSGNTGYYCDPASTSNLNGVNIQGLLQVAGSTGNYNEGMRLVSGTGSWSNIQFGANMTGAGTQANQWIVGKRPDGNFVISLAGNQEGGSRFLIQQDGRVQSPVYYDGDDTNYYVDPNGSSRMVTVNADRLATPYAQNPDNSHPGFGIRPFYSWNTGQANNPTAGYSNGISIGSHPGDQSYGFQIVQNMWDDNLYFRRYNAGWQGWRTALDSSNYTGYRDWGGNAIYAGILYDGNNTGYYVDPASTSRMNYINADFIRSYSYLYLDYQYGSTVVGVYNSTKFQGVFAMGDSYKLAIDGTSCANHYGIAWSHPNAGGQAANLSSHGMLVQQAGTTMAAISTNIWASGDIIAYSDIRVKDNIQIIDNPLERLKKVRGVTFTRTDFEDKEKRYAGVIAQEMREALPEVVSENSEGHLSVSYGNTVSLLIEAIKEQQTQIEELKQLVKQLINK